MLVLLPIGSHAQPHAGISGDTLRLETVFAAINEANPALHVLQLEAEALASRPQQVGALPDPIVGVTVQPAPVHTARGTQRAQLRVEQMLPFPGKRTLHVQVSESDAEMARLNAAAYAQDLMRWATLAFLKVQQTQVHAGHVAMFQARLRDFEAVATTRYEVGTGSQQSILKAQLERNRLSLRLAQLEADRRHALEELGRLLGQPVQARYVEPLVLKTRDLPDSALAVAVAARPEAAALEVAALQAQQEEALARRAFYPDFLFSLNYVDIARSDVPPTSDGRDALAVGVGVRVPLWRDKLEAGVEEAHVQQRIVEARREAQRLDWQAQLNDLAERFRQLQQQRQLMQETLLPQAEATLEATRSAYATGQVDFSELLDADRTLFSLHMEETDIQIQLLQTAAEIDRVLGINWMLATPLVESENP